MTSPLKPSRFLTLGIEGLDTLFPGAAYPGSLIVVAGNPGTGKTTFAVTVCYNNAVRNEKCLYISFQEPKWKLFMYMSNLGLDLSGLEEKNLLKYVYLPLTTDINSIADTILKLIADFKPSILVIDSVTPLLVSAGEAEKRAWLQNFFYGLAEQGGMLVLLVDEIPYGGEKLSLSEVEFVADAVFILKYRIEASRVSRILEARKVRGSPLNVAEMPYMIIKGKGVSVFTPPILEEIPGLGEEKYLYPCIVPTDPLGLKLRRGDIVYVTYPPRSGLDNVLTAMHLALVLASEAKTLLISYRYSPRQMRDAMMRVLEDYGVSREHQEKIIDRYLVFKSINPTSMSLGEIASWILNAVEESRPDIVVMHGVDVFPMLYKHQMSEYIPLLFNILLALRGKGILVVRSGALVGEEGYYLNSVLSDTIIEFKEDTRDYSMVVKIRGKPPAYISVREVERCLHSYLKNHINANILPRLKG